MIGAPYVGKTTAALALAQELISRQSVYPSQMLSVMPNAPDSIVVSIDSIFASFFDLDVRREEIVARVQALTDLNKDGRISSKSLSSPLDKTASDKKRLKSITPGATRSKIEEESKESIAANEAPVLSEETSPSSLLPAEAIIDSETTSINDQVREVAKLIRTRVLDYHEVLLHERDEREQAIKLQGKGH